MVRRVDLSQRQRDLTDAAIRILSERGVSALTLRALAREMGGSITLITHFYSDRDQMLEAILETILEDYDREIETLHNSVEPEQQLRALLLWLVPRDETTLRLERGRMLLVAERETDDAARRFLEAHEIKMRQHLHDHLRPWVSEPRLSQLVDAFRVLTTGLTLSTVEHPERWPAHKQEQLIDFMMQSLGVGELAHSQRKSRRSRERSA